MLMNFRRFQQRISARYDEVYDCLNANRYEEAQLLLADIARSHARTSLSLRNVLVRDGLIKEEK